LSTPYRNFSEPFLLQVVSLTRVYEIVLQTILSSVPAVVSF